MRRHGLIGCEGGQARNNIRYSFPSPGLRTFFFDVKDPEQVAVPQQVEYHQVVGERLDPNWLAQFRLDSAHIVTQDACHPAIIEACVRAGVTDVISEKMLACSPNEALKLRAALDDTLDPSQEVRVNDIYALRWLRRLPRSVRSALGKPIAVWVRIYESRGVESELDAYRQMGCDSFSHHPTAILWALQRGVSELRTNHFTQSWTSCYSQAPEGITETYRAFRVVDTNFLYIAEVAKYLKDAKLAVFVCEHGKAAISLDPNREWWQAWLEGEKSESQVPKHCDAYATLLASIASRDIKRFTFSLDEAIGMIDAIAHCRSIARFSDIYSRRVNLVELFGWPYPEFTPDIRFGHGSR